MAGTTRASVAELDAAMKAGDVVIVDVRTAAEFRSGHIAGALSHPVQTLKAASLELPDDQPLWLICKSGRRSAMGAKLLNQTGLDVVDVEGGMTAWKAAGLPVVQGTASFPWIPLVATLTLGLAPFGAPHLFDKLGMLTAGTLTSPLDIFDLLMHGAPWVWLAVATRRYLAALRRDAQDASDP